MSRFFQHIHKDDELFGEVTELSMIDDSDPDLVLYHFTDGTKCNPLFIGKINDPSAFDNGMMMAEIPSVTNKWEFEVVEIKKQQYFTTDTSGERCEVVDPYMQNRAADVKTVKVKRKPRYVEMVNESKPTIPEPTKQNEIAVVQPPMKEEVSKPNNVLEFDDATLDLSQPLFGVGITRVSFMKNDAKVYMDLDEVFRRLTEDPKPSPKIEVAGETHLELSVDAAQKTMVDNMIDMSKKMECSINIELGLNIPPKSVYGLINSGYPEEISDAFVKILADRIHIRSLKQAVADGLMEYYQEGLPTETDE